MAAMTKSEIVDIWQGGNYTQGAEHRDGTREFTAFVGWNEIGTFDTEQEAAEAVRKEFWRIRSLEETHE